MRRERKKKKHSLFALEKNVKFGPGGVSAGAEGWRGEKACQRGGRIKKNRKQRSRR